MKIIFKSKKFVISIFTALLILFSYIIGSKLYNAHYKAKLVSKFPLIKSIVDTNIPSGYQGYYSPIILKDGNFLLFGGTNFQNIGLYDPVKNKFKVIGKFNDKFITDPYAFELSDSKVLFLSNSYSFYNKISKKQEYNSNNIGIFDLKTKKLSYIGKLKLNRTYFTATLLKNGKILVAGGYSKNKIALRSEILDPKTGKSYFTGNTIYPEYQSKALLLRDGNVLIVGSIYNPDKAELYVTNLGKFVKVGDLVEKYSSIVKASDKVKVLPYSLANGKVLILNSTSTYKNDTSNETNQSIEIYEPESRRFTHITDLAVNFLTDYSLQGILISDNKFIVIGFPVNTSFVCEPLSCDNLRCAHLVLELVDLKTYKTKTIGSLPPIRGSKVSLLDKNTLFIWDGQRTMWNELNNLGFILSVKSLKGE